MPSQHLPSGIGDTEPAPPTVRTTDRGAVPRGPLRWRETPIVLASESPETRRAWSASLALELAGLGAAETWPGRRAAYADVVALAESPIVRHSYAPDVPQRTWAASSCGLVVRRLWWALGVDGRLGAGRVDVLVPPYRVGLVMADLEGVARACGAWRSAPRDGAEVQRPREGEVLVFGGGSGQHIATVVEVGPGDVLVTVDGGQAGGLGGGTEIAVRSREVGATWAVPGSARYVRGCVDVGALVYVAERAMQAPEFVEDVSVSV